MRFACDQSNYERPRSICSAPKALSHPEPGASAQGSDCPANQALKVRLNLVARPTRGGSESRFQRWRLGEFYESWGAAQKVRHRESVLWRTWGECSAFGAKHVRFVSKTCGTPVFHFPIA